MLRSARLRQQQSLARGLCAKIPDSVPCKTCARLPPAPGLLPAPSLNPHLHMSW